MVNKYKKSLFISSLKGQYKIWKKDIVKLCNRVDEIYQLGNVVGCNPYVADKETFGPNEALLKYVLLYKSTEPNWTQIIGPNEIAALNSPEEWTNKNSRKILRDIWLNKEPIAKVAAVSKNRLVTHSGLTFGEWTSIGKPQTALETSKILNEKYNKTLYQGPSFRLGNNPNFSANPIWADPFMELYPSWITANETCPFDQIVGSSSLNTDRGRFFVSNKDSFLRYVDKVFFRKWGSITKIKDSFITSIDLDLKQELITDIPETNIVYVEKLKLN